MTKSLIQLFIGLPLVIVLAYISLRLTNKYMRKMTTGRFLQVGETVQVFNRSAVSVVRIGEEYHVLGVTDAQVTTLKILDEAEARAFEASRDQGLRRLLDH